MYEGGETLKLELVSKDKLSAFYVEKKSNLHSRIQFKQQVYINRSTDNIKSDDW